MPLLDSCISSLFEPGNIPASSGEPPVQVILGSLEDPDDYNPDAVTYSLDFTKFYNSGYSLFLFGW